MQRKLILSSSEVEILARLGRTLRLARLRRNMSQTDLGERIGVARTSIAALEDGQAGTGIGVLLKILSVLGNANRLEEILAYDPLGEEIEATEGRLRAGRRPDVAPF